MCLFYNQKKVIVKGLLKRAEDFPIPVGNKFPGAVMIGWKYWKLSDEYQLCSPSFSTIWTPGKPLVSAKPNQSSGCGIYCFGSKEPAIARAKDAFTVGNVWGSIALWGSVLDFPDGLHARKQGCMGEFAYPLEINLPASGPLFPALKLAALWTPTGTEVFRGDEKL